MAEEVVVRNVLSDDMVKAGANIIQQLDRAKFTIDAAFWLHLPDSNQWRLVLASPEVGVHGPKKGYKRVQSALTKMLEPRLSLQDISMMDSIDPLVLLLKNAIRTGPGISGIRFTRNTINGVLIDDAYIYRLV
jgi:hypothetical protein